jgi:hypothetical protein
MENNDIVTARAYAGLKSAVQARGADPEIHLAEISRFALHGGLTTEAQFEIIAGKIVESGTRHQAPASNPQERAEQLRREGVLGPNATTSAHDFSADKARERELRKLGIV